MDKNYSDKELIYLINSGDQGRTLAMEYLHTKHANLINYGRKVISNQLHHKEAQEAANGIYNMAIATVVNNIMQNRFEGTKAIAPYLKGTLVNLCKQHIDKAIRKKTSDISDEKQVRTLLTSESTKLLDDDWKRCVETAIAYLNPKFQQILRLRMQQYSFKEIANIMNYGSAVIARVTHGRARKKLAEIIENHPELQRLIKELLKKDL